jgi:hypothetical protein
VIAAYVSGHGFGHATRVGEVLRVVRELEPERPLAVVTSGPEQLYREAIPGALLYRGLAVDVGLVQHDALTIDETGTAEAWRSFVAGWDAMVEREASWLRRSGARMVLADIPPLAFEAAARAGVPTVGLANFSWDWIYRYLGERHPALARAAEQAAAAYGQATLLLELPFAGDLSAFPHRERIPLVARRPRLARREARRRLGVTEPVLVLVSFGGVGLPGLDPRRLPVLPDVRFLVSGCALDLPDHVAGITSTEWVRLGLGYQDLVGAADVVVSKPGYGIVSDAIAARTRLVYTDRGDFPEYPILVREMQAWLPSAHLGNRELLGGALAGPIEEVLSQPFPEPPALDGARVAAQRLLSVG